MRYHSQTPHGFSRVGLRSLRRKRKWQGQCEIHLIVPKSPATHPTLVRYDYDVEADYNFALLPTRAGADRLLLRHSRPLHDGGHAAYNRFTVAQLSGCVSLTDFLALLCLLHFGCRGRRSVPWR
jgi:hypothetical protein